MIFQLKKQIKKLRALGRSVILKDSLSKTRGFRILMYHSVGGKPEDHKFAIRVPEEIFEREIDKIVNDGYKTFTISEIARNRKAILSGKSIAITFDDGYRDNIIAAAVKLRKLGLRATFFVTVSYIDGIVTKKWHNGMPREFMTWVDIKRLNDMGFEIGSHMMRHVDLTSLNDKDMRFEIEKSKDIISRHIGKPVDTCSYPYGGVNDKVMAMVKSAGYMAACSSFSGWNDLSGDICILKRTEIDGYDTINDLRLKLKGFYD